MTKRSLILWSGGYDSTALVMRSVAKNKPFDLLYVELENNKIKSEAELKAQDKILKKLKCEELLRELSKALNEECHNPEPPMPTGFYETPKKGCPFSSSLVK